MAKYEYKVVAAPHKTKAFKGVRSHEDRFASVLAEVMNGLAGRDWEYLRAESLPCEEKAGLTRRVESFQSVLVFRRKIVANQKFFEVPPARQIELHHVAEDKTEQDVVFASAHRHASVTPISGDMHEVEEPATKAGVLAILRNRKARLVRAQTEGDSEPLKMAGE